MDIFGFKEHDDRGNSTDRQVRRLVELVAQLSIDLAETRGELRSLKLEVSGKADQVDFDPAIVAINNGLRQARASLAATTASAEDEWSELSGELSESLAELRLSIENAPAPAHVS